MHMMRNKSKVSSSHRCIMIGDFSGAVTLSDATFEETNTRIVILLMSLRMSRAHHRPFAESAFSCIGKWRSWATASGCTFESLIRRSRWSILPEIQVISLAFWDVSTGEDLTDNSTKETLKYVLDYGVWFRHHHGLFLFCPSTILHSIIRCKLTNSILTGPQKETRMTPSRIDIQNLTKQKH